MFPTTFHQDRFASIQRLASILLEHRCTLKTFEYSFILDLYHRKERPQRACATEKKMIAQCSYIVQTCLILDQYTNKIKMLYNLKLQIEIEGALLYPATVYCTIILCWWEDMRVERGEVSLALGGTTARAHRHDHVTAILFRKHQEARKRDPCAL
jgi:hypothetical protein